MKKLLLSAASLLALSAPLPAQAADILEPMPFDWTGPYVGLNVGAAIFSDDLELSDIANEVSSDDSETDVTFGAQLGYNFQTDNLLLGIEADINYLDAGDDLLLAGKAWGATWESDHDWFATIRARAGLVSDQTLFYITGGIAFLDATYNLDGTNPVSRASEDDVLIGWTIGGGIEHAFSENWSAKIEYLYADFESVREDLFATVAFSASADPDLHVIRAGLNYHF